MDNVILLTYVVPVYNTGRYLNRCLQSIMDQDLDDDNFEVLVIDDGSTDDSLEVAAAFAADHPQVRLFEQTNAGVSAARNLALDNARGTFVQFVDSDDYLSQGVMKPLLLRAVNEELDVLQFNYARVNDQGSVVSDFRDDINPTTGVSTGADFLKSHSMTPYVWRFLVNRDYLNQRNLRFDTSLIVCEDGALIADFLLNARRMAHDQATPYCYVSRADSAMHNPDAEHLKRRIFSQVDSAISIDRTARKYESSTGQKVPGSVDGVRDVYLYFSMTKALMCSCVDETLDRIRKAGLFPFPCVGPVAHYEGIKWKVIHSLMMRPRLWKFLSKVYRMIKK